MNTQTLSQSKSGHSLLLELPAYFEFTINAYFPPDTFRDLAPTVSDGTLHHNPDQWRKLAQKRRSNVGGVCYRCVAPS